MFVAVYGTLKQGYANNRRLLAGHTPVHALFVEIPYLMYEGDAFPMIVPSSERYPIYVEVFEVDHKTLAKLDQLEAPYSYHRETVFIRELEHPVEIYVYNKLTPPSYFKRVESGRWNGSGNL